VLPQLSGLQMPLGIVQGINDKHRPLTQHSDGYNY
jgi:hypothetical protein